MTDTRCTLVEPVIRGFVTVKYDDEPQPVRLPLKAWERCARIDTAPVVSGAFTFHRCEKHR